MERGVGGVPFLRVFEPCTALHCTVLCYTALHCTPFQEDLFRPALHHIALHCTTLCLVAPFGTALHRTAMHRTAPECIAPLHIALHCTALHRIASLCTVLPLHCTPLPLHCHCTATALPHCTTMHCTALHCTPTLPTLVFHAPGLHFSSSRGTVLPLGKFLVTPFLSDGAGVR